MTTTNIEWTRGDDGSPGMTWNPVRGCTRVSPGCGGPKHEGGCYAEKIAARFSDPGQPFHGFAKRTKHGGAWTGKLALIDDMLTLPLRWRKPRRIFVNSMSDLFHENLPDEAIDKVFAVMALCPQHTFQVLTKRSARMRDYMANVEREALWMGSVANLFTSFPDLMNRCYPIIMQREPWLPLPNVWLGVSAEDQARADERIPDLLATPAAKRFVSAEPLLGPVDLRRIPLPAEDRKALLDCLDHPDLADMRSMADEPFDALSPPRYSEWLEETVRFTRLDWVIAGGESGGGARPSHPDWFRALRDQCASAGVPFFFKQWGEWLAGENLMLKRPVEPATWQDGEIGQHSTCIDRPESKTPEWRHSGQPGEPGVFWLKVGKKRAGATLDGREHREFPR